MRHKPRSSNVGSFLTRCNTDEVSWKTLKEDKEIISGMLSKRSEKVGGREEGGGRSRRHSGSSRCIAEECVDVLVPPVVE